MTFGQKWPRTYLYVPGDRPDRFMRAARSGADALIIDLEDSVAGPAKAAALGHVVRFLEHDQARRPPVWVRINAGEHGLADLDALRGAPDLAGVVVAKADLTQLSRLTAVDATVRRCALVESARAVLEVAGIAADPLVDALAIGEVDLAADLGVRLSADGRELHPIRLQLVVASSAYGLAAPIGPVIVDLQDEALLGSVATSLSRNGFGGQQVIHPCQVDAVNKAFSPSTEEVVAARELLDRAEAQSGTGATRAADGSMVDGAVLRQARAVIRRSRTRTGHGHET